MVPLVSVFLFTSDAKLGEGANNFGGYLAKLIGKVSESLGPAYAESFERLPGEAVLNIDETGHKENGAKFWTWCFRAQVYTLFRIDKSRGSRVLAEVLGEEFNGTVAKAPCVL